MMSSHTDTDKPKMRKATERLVFALPVASGIGLIGGHRANTINQEQGDAEGNLLVNDYTRGILSALGGGAAGVAVANSIQGLRAGGRRAAMERRDILDDIAIREQLELERLRAAEIAGYLGAGVGVGAQIGAARQVTPEELEAQQRAEDLALLAGALGGA